MFKKSRSNLLELVPVNTEETVSGNILLKDVDGYDVMPYKQATNVGMGESENTEDEFICVYYMDGSKKFYSAGQFDVIINE